MGSSPIEGADLIFLHFSASIFGVTKHASKLEGNLLFILFFFVIFRDDYHCFFVGSNYHSRLLHGALTSTPTASYAQPCLCCTYNVAQPLTFSLHLYLSLYHYLSMVVNPFCTFQPKNCSCRSPAPAQHPRALLMTSNTIRYQPQRIDCIH